MSGHLQALEEDLSCVIFAKETSNFNSLDRLLEVGLAQWRLVLAQWRLVPWHALFLLYLVVFPLKGPCKCQHTCKPWKKNGHVVGTQLPYGDKMQVTLM